MKKSEIHLLIEQEQKNICQICAYKNGKVVYTDEWNNYQPNDTTHIMSATKSVIALLIGILVDIGKIRSVDDKVLDYFHLYKVKRGEKTIQEITIKHLLTMQAPYKCMGDPWTKVCTSEDWTKASLDFLGGRKVITCDFNYQTVCLHILSGLIEQASGMKTIDFANVYLFRPLGINERKIFIADTAEKHKAFTISKTPKEEVWFAGPKDSVTAGYGLCMSAIDMAKIGQMILDNGLYNGKQIISKEWLELIFTPTAKLGERFRHMSYGYLWWIIDQDRRIYAAVGNSGNVIYINETDNIVVAISSYFKPTVFDRVDFIMNVVETSVKEMY